jgi:tyrosinase
VISLTRRSLIKGIAALPVAMGLAPLARAGDLKVRYDIASTQGQAMLAIYADAVRQMQAMGPDNPMSWMWQWYTHFVDSATTKANEISRIFGSNVTPASSLANEMWDTCQSHSGQNSNYFLPWHRMFLYYMEQIISTVSGHPEFAMPYWNYTSSDPTQRGVLPLQFRLKDDATFSSLYRPDRTTLANTGQPIQKNQTGDPMDISTAMACTSYSTVGTVQGFCRAIDSGIHGRIHVLVGTSKDMGAVPFAGRDPLFWVHHSSIDRMWASWNANGGVNPTTASWATKTFVFANGSGQRVSDALKNYFDIGTLGYCYDQLIPPAAAAATTSSATKMASTSSTASVTPQRVANAQAAELAATPVRVALSPVAGLASTSVLGLDQSSDKRTYLVLKDLHTWKQPEVLYHVYLGPAHGGASRSNYVGNINFFDAEFHDHGHGAMGAAIGENFYSFDVTDLLKKIARSGAADVRNSLMVSFVPGGIPTPGGKPLVSTIELVQQ